MTYQIMAGTTRERDLATNSVNRPEQQNYHALTRPPAGMNSDRMQHAVLARIEISMRINISRLKKTTLPQTIHVGRATHARHKQ